MLRTGKSALLPDASPDALPPWLLAVWLAVALAVLLPLLAGLVVVRRMGRKAAPFADDSLPHMARSLAESLGLRVPIALRCAPSGTMPMATGLLRPAVFLPKETETWSDEKRRAVLLHELAHVKRRDCLTHALARVALALHWFNPLAWLALRQLRVEREHACDDLVLSAGERPSVYADHLLEIARTMRAGTITSAAAITMAKKNHLEGRLLAVLDTRRNRKLLTHGFVITAIVASSGAVLFLGSITTASEKEIQSTSDLLALAKPVKEASPANIPGLWRYLRFSLTEEEEADSALCTKLVQQSFTTVNGINQFTLPEVRTQLEEILDRRPGFFYAEHGLGTWYQMTGNQPQADRYFLQSYRHAPAVLVQRYEDAEKNPIVGVNVGIMEYACYTFDILDPDSSQKLYFHHLTTDENGCIYMPVYNTLLLPSRVGYPEGTDISYPSFDMVEIQGKVGLLPTAGVGIVGGLYEEAVASDGEGRVRIDGRDFQVEKVWRMDAEEAMQPRDPQAGYCDHSHNKRFPELADGKWDCLLVDIGGKGRSPKDFDVIQLRVFDHTTRKLLWDSDWGYRTEGRTDIFTGGFSNCLKNAVFLARRNKTWPETIDIWFRADFLKDTGMTHHHLPVNTPNVVIRSTGTGSVAIEEIRAGSWSRTYSEGGGDVTWNSLNPGTEDSQCSIVLRRTGDWGGGRMNVCAIDKQGNKHWAQSIHFVDFKRSALQVVNFPVAADQIRELKFGEVENQQDFRKTFYFDGVKLPAIAEGKSTETQPHEESTTAGADAAVRTTKRVAPDVAGPSHATEVKDPYRIRFSNGTRATW